MSIEHDYRIGRNLVAHFLARNFLKTDCVVVEEDVSTRGGLDVVAALHYSLPTLVDRLALASTLSEQSSQVVDIGFGRVLRQQSSLLDLSYNTSKCFDCLRFPLLLPLSL